MQLIVLVVCLGIQFATILWFYGRESSIVSIAKGAFLAYGLNFVLILFTSTRHIFSAYVCFKVVGIHILCLVYSYFVLLQSQAIGGAGTGLVNCLIKILLAWTMLVPLGIFGVWITGQIGRTKELLGAFGRMVTKKVVTRIR